MAQMTPDYNIGDYEVHVDDEALKAVVIFLPTGKPIKRFKGETAWSDARRHAEDLYWIRKDL